MGSSYRCNSRGCCSPAFPESQTANQISSFLGALLESDEIDRASPCLPARNEASEESNDASILLLRFCLWRARQLGTRL